MYCGFDFVSFRITGTLVSRDVFGWSPEVCVNKVLLYIFCSLEFGYWYPCTAISCAESLSSKMTCCVLKLDIKLYFLGVLSVAEDASVC